MTTNVSRLYFLFILFTLFLCTAEKLSNTHQHFPQKLYYHSDYRYKINSIYVTTHVIHTHKNINKSVHELSQSGKAQGITTVLNT